MQMYLRLMLHFEIGSEASGSCTLTKHVRQNLPICYGYQTLAVMSLV